MLKLLCSLALLSAACAGAHAGTLVPGSAPQAAAALVVQVGCDGGNSSGTNAERRVRRQGNCGQPADRSSSSDDRRIVNRRIVDCHRDVRRHRIGGVMIRHRHVGDNCAVREVRISN